MVENKLYREDVLPFSVHDLVKREEPRRIFLVKPEYFEVIDVKNPYMEGSSIKKETAWKQWQDLYNIYKGIEERGILHEVAVLDGEKGCEDMVFCANQSLPWQVSGKNSVIMSHMRHPSRQREVAPIEAFYTGRGYSVYHLHTDDLLEGNGDIIPHPAKNLLWAGYGHRSGLGALEEVAEILEVPVVPLELVSEYFYHLDTCFVPLSTEAVMLCPEAFTEHGLQLVEQLFDRVHLISSEEAVSTFSLNAHCLSYPEAKIAVLQQGSKEVVKVLQMEGYEIQETDTREFMKSGGSVFCMKMMFY